MKNEITEFIQEIVTEEGGVYTTLFGCEELEEHHRLNINWIFNRTELKESIRLVMEHIVSQVLQSYNAHKYDPDRTDVSANEKLKWIHFDGKETANHSLPINYDVTDSGAKFADLENY